MGNLENLFRHASAEVDVCAKNGDNDVVVGLCRDSAEVEERLVIQGASSGGKRAMSELVITNAPDGMLHVTQNYMSADGKKLPISEEEPLPPSIVREWISIFMRPKL